MQRVDGVDWNKSCMHLVSHIKKIRVVEGVQCSRKAVISKRGLLQEGRIPYY
jgi:hypothetical protein